MIVRNDVVYKEYNEMNKWEQMMQRLYPMNGIKIKNKWYYRI